LCPLPCDPKDWETFEMEFDRWAGNNNELMQKHFDEIQRELEQALNELRTYIDQEDDAGLEQLHDNLRKLYEEMGQDLEVKKFSVIIRLEELNEADAKLNAAISRENNLDVSQLAFSPNPNDGRFNLSFRLSSDEALTLQIFDVAGKEIYTERITNFGGAYSNTIDISEYPRGTYILQIEQEGKTFSKKVVIQ
jgi:hypothetical protein